MEAFPKDYISRNVPLIFLSGIGQEAEDGQDQKSRGLLQDGGFRIRRESPAVTGQIAQEISLVFDSFDNLRRGLGYILPPHMEAPGPFTFRYTGQSFALPPRKASPPPHAPPLGPLSDSIGPSPSVSLHSTISPLTPGSPLYPDGMITPLWVAKHQSCLPAVLILFFSLVADPTISSLRDNQIKNEINSIRSVLSSTNYKTKLVVVLLNESSTEDVVDLNSRLGAIRKNTGLDTKHLSFLGPPFTRDAIFESVKSILSPLQPFCVEYYRDLSKHSRRKRNRSSVPPPTSPPTAGTSRALPVQGWNVRYEFKLGIFAEFRQEFDAACRNYESAHDGLFSDEIFGSIPAWSPRFTEARLLADLIAIRILRCLLQTEQLTQATRFWSKHRRRTKELVDSKGKGSSNYGWETWEVIWAKSFAQLQDSSRYAASFDEPLDRPRVLQFASAEKAISIGERMNPWELLHHEGYWLSKSIMHTKKRRELALQIPEEDRVPPGQRSRQELVERSNLYDVYLAKEPHLEYAYTVENYWECCRANLKVLENAMQSFSTHKQDRFADRFRMGMVEEYVRKGETPDAGTPMSILWFGSSWKRNGWWALTKEMAMVVKGAAIQLKDREMLLRLEWEAHNAATPLIPGFKYDMVQLANELGASDGTLDLVLKSESCLSPVWASFGFGAGQGNVGEPLEARLVLVSNAQQTSKPIPLTEIEVKFHGGLRPITFKAGGKAADDAEVTTSETSPTDAQEVDEKLMGDTSYASKRDSVAAPTVVDLTMSPKQERSFPVLLSPREDGEVRVSSISIIYKTKWLKLTYLIDDEASLSADGLLSTRLSPKSRRLGGKIDSSTVQILPKPPKLKLSLPKTRKHYYTNEEIDLLLKIENEESGAADIAIEVQLSSHSDFKPSIKWTDLPAEAENRPSTDSEDETATGRVLLPERQLSSIESGAVHESNLTIGGAPDSVQHELQVTARYRVLDDPDIELSKVLITHLIIERPFEANYELLPQAHTEPWATFFDPLTTNAGISQKFLFVAKLVSFVSQPVVIERVTAQAHRVSSKAECTVSGDQENSDQAASMLAPEEFRQSTFEVDICNRKFGEAYSLGVDLSISIQWKRSPASPLITTVLHAPRYLLPMSEPRVLLHRDNILTAQSGSTRLLYTIENPSIHYLTFNLAMETSDEFAFSGPKAVTFSLVPLSRHTVSYHILAHQGGRWLRINLAVTDAYFSKSLRVSSAGEGNKSDGKKGVLVWVD